MREFPKDFNLTKAAIRAGYSAKTAHVQGAQVLRRLRVRAALETRLAQLADRADVSAERVVGLEEKPAHPRSSLAMTGLYFADGRAPEIAARLLPSTRGELEIVDLFRAYLAEGSLRLRILGRGIAWLDTGTLDATVRRMFFG